LTQRVQGLAADFHYQDIKAGILSDFKTDSGLIGTKSVITYATPDYPLKLVVYGFQIGDLVQCYTFDTLRSDADGEKSVDTALKTLKLRK
jgi:hypothetical protein